MTKVFSNFWQINLGHVGTLAVVVFGIGVAWRSVSAQQDQDRASSLARDDALSATVAAAVSERNLRIAAVADRLAKDEEALRNFSAMDREVATLNAQMKALNDELAGFRAELRAYQLARSSR